MTLTTQPIRSSQRSRYFTVPRLAQYPITRANMAARKRRAADLKQMAVFQAGVYVVTAHGDVAMMDAPWLVEAPEMDTDMDMVDMVGA